MHDFNFALIEYVVIRRYHNKLRGKHNIDILISTLILILVLFWCQQLLRTISVFSPA